MTTPPPAAADTGRTGAAPQTPARPRRAPGWVGAVTDRVPTGWLTGILTVPFLAVTAAFGGLNAVAAPPVPDLEAGETHENGPFALTVERAVLIDELPEAGITIAEEDKADTRVLALVVTVENLWSRALPAGHASGVTGAVRIDQLGDLAPAAVARFDDATTAPFLQPGVPAELVLTWAVDADLFADGDALEIDLRDFTLQTGQLITYGTWWANPVEGARLTVDVTDVGAGADAGEDGEG